MCAIATDSYTCAEGTFLPADSTSCAQCPTGWTCAGGTFEFNATEFQGLAKSATYMAGDEANVCAANYGHNIYAIFSTDEYTCQTGYFLPADALGCAPCPTGYTCSGGTYAYNATQSQGLTRVAEYYTANETNACAVNFAHVLNASFVPAQYTCDAGQYLPADAVECVTCLADNLCAGGTYTFNTTTDQGIVPANCENGYSAPAGSSSCTPNIIQITWQGAELEDVLANHAETCTYGGDLRTPVKAIHIPGMTFVGWTVAPQE